MKFCAIVLCVLVTSHCCKAELVEDVTKEGANGTEVVNQVVDLIGRLCILHNELFLRRMAYVETRDGTNPDTYKQGNNGGIWNIDEGIFNTTKQDVKLVGVYSILKKSLNIDWTTVEWADLRKPLYSGLAATVFLVSRNYQRIPESLEVQASIWGTVRPQNAPNTFFFDASTLNTGCRTDKQLDIVVVLDFANITVIETVRIQTFLESLFANFQLALNRTRVGLVTKNLRPIAGWYLNSQRPAFTFLTALKALKYVPGPTVTGDSLKFTRETMFNSTNGARKGAAKVVLLLTNGVTQLDYTKEETKKLKDLGCSMLIIEVKTGANSTSRQQLEKLVDPPSCRNVRVVDGYEKLGTILEEVELSLCNATLTMTDGDYEFPCSTPVSAKLPSSSTSVTIQVKTTDGAVDVFMSKAYSAADEHLHDVHMTANQTDGRPLFIRGSDPMFIQVKSNTCTGNFTVHIETGLGAPGGAINGKNGTCIIAGTIRDCTAMDMDIALHDIVLIPDTETSTLCDSSNNSIEYYPHPLEPRSFIMCDRHDVQYIGLCPVNQSSCVQFTSGCKYTNPCTKEAILKGQMYHNDPCGYPNTYLKCSQFGIAEKRECHGARLWNLDTEHCVFKYLHDPLNAVDDTTIDNPCIHSHEDHVYFPYPGSASKYILCDKYGNAFLSYCRNGVWNQQTKSCTVINRPVG